MCLFRFKLWWMTQRMGTCGNDIPLETQFMLVESKDTTEGEREDAPTIYTVFLPLLEGQFRAVLQGNEKNEMEICLESGEFPSSHWKILQYHNVISRFKQSFFTHNEQCCAKKSFRISLQVLYPISTKRGYHNF